MLGYMVAMVALLLSIEMADQSDPICSIPQGMFEGMVADSSIDEPFYGHISQVDIAPFQRTVWMCLPFYCPTDICDCSSPDKTDTYLPDSIRNISCFVKMTSIFQKKNVCDNNYVEDELRVCRAPFNCTFNSLCDQHCEKNTTDGKTVYYCACNPGYVRWFDGKNGSCIKPTTCDQLNGGCEHVCSVKDNSTSCSCRQGFVLDDNGKTCNAPTTPLPLPIPLATPSTTTLFSPIIPPASSLEVKASDPFPWPYILAIVLAVFVCLIIVLVIVCIFLRLNRGTNTRVEKTTVVHYEKSARNGNQAPHVIIVPAINGTEKKTRVEDPGDGEYQEVRNLKALASGPAGANQYEGQVYDEIENDLNGNGVYKDKVHKLDNSRKSKRGSSTNTDDPYSSDSIIHDANSAYGEGSKHRDVSLVHGSGGGHVDTDKRSRSTSESRGDKGKSGKGSDSKKSGSEKNKSSGKDSGGSGKSAGGSGKDAGGSGKGSGKTKSTTQVKEVYESYGKLGKGDNGPSGKSGKDVHEASGKSGKGSGSSKHNDADKKSSRKHSTSVGEGSGGKETSGPPSSADQQRNGAKNDKSVYTRSISTEVSSSPSNYYNNNNNNKSKQFDRSISEDVASARPNIENDYSGNFERYDLQNTENESAAYTAVSKPSKAYADDDGTYANSDQRQK